MAWDIETARVRVGLDAADASRDTELQAAMAAAVAIAERWCDRGLVEQTDAVEEHYKVSSSFLLLFRYPITDVLEVDVDGDVLDPEEYRFYSSIGELHFDDHYDAETVVVTYTAGYEPLPPDVELALWSLFDQTWAGFEEPGTVTGQVRSESIAGVGSVQYVTTEGFVGPAAAAVLMPYRRLRA